MDARWSILSTLALIQSSPEALVPGKAWISEITSHDSYGFSDYKFIAEELKSFYDANSEDLKSLQRGNMDICLFSQRFVHELKIEGRKKILLFSCFTKV